MCVTPAVSTQQSRNWTSLFQRTLTTLYASHSVGSGCPTCLTRSHSGSPQYFPCVPTFRFMARGYYSMRKWYWPLVVVSLGRKIHPGGTPHQLGKATGLLRLESGSCTKTITSQQAGQRKRSACSGAAPEICFAAGSRFSRRVLLARLRSRWPLVCARVLQAHGVPCPLRGDARESCRPPETGSGILECLDHMFFEEC